MWLNNLNFPACFLILGVGRSANVVGNRVDVYFLYRFGLLFFIGLNFHLNQNGEEYAILYLSSMMHH